MTPEPVVVPDIDPVEADRLTAGGAFLLDVREDDEWVAGHALAAVHVRMGDIVDRISELPKDRPVLCLCRVGGRSATVAAHLAGVGFDVSNVAGGMLAWAAAGLDVVDETGAAGHVV